MRLPGTNAETERPEGLVYVDELITTEEESRLVGILDSLRFDDIVLHGQAARRTGRHFGLDYDYGTRTPRLGEVLPEWLLPIRGRAYELLRQDASHLEEVLVQRYPPGAGIGWHRDAPAFDSVVGVLLGAASRLRFRRGRVRKWELWETELFPRSGYVLAGPARTSWEHSIPPTKELRYSITFRTLRRG